MQIERNFLKKTLKNELKIIGTFAGSANRTDCQRFNRN